MEAADIKGFVQNTLGCGCPEEVFRHIDCVAGVRREGIDLRYRINIGNRLLVYVASIDGGIPLREVLPKLLDVGVRERDSSGFNRFRLVLATDDHAVTEAAEKLFRDHQHDEKVHLHLLPTSSIPTL